MPLIFTKNNQSARIKNFPLPHLITTNLFGDCGTSDPNFETEQNNKIRHALGGDAFFKTRAEHGGKISVIQPAERTNNYVKGDGLIYFKDNKNFKPVFIITTADCPIVFLSDQNKSFIGLLHCGWRGIKENIIEKAMQILAGSGIEPRELIAGIWPGICGLCYEVGPELEQYFPGHIHDHHLDLRSVIVERLLEHELNQQNIFSADNKVYCARHYLADNKPVFASFRRDHDNFRNAAAISF